MVKGWGYWDYRTAGRAAPEPYEPEWGDLCEAIQRAAKVAPAAAKSRRKVVTLAQPVSVTRCAECGCELEKRRGAKTCSAKCRKAYSRRNQPTDS